MEDTGEHPCPTVSVCKWTRNAIREFCTNIVWVVLGKYSAILLIIASVAIYGYKSDSNNLSEKLAVLVEQSREQGQDTQKMLIALQDMKHLQQDVAELKQNNEVFKREIIRRVTALEVK